MFNLRPLCECLTLIALISLIIASGLFAASWDSFKPATFTDISLDKLFQANVLDYTLMLGITPTVTIDSKTYPVNWVQAFYVVSGTSNGVFTATNDMSANSWSWDDKSNPAQISGWKTQGSNRLIPGNSMQFNFGSFDPQGNPVVPGFHISYQDGKNSVTDWFKARTTIIPEPSTLAGVGTAMGGGLFFFAWRRKTRRLS